MPDDQFPVRWTGRRAIVAFPERVDVTNVDRLRDRLLSVIGRGAAVVIADMTGTLSCDHVGMDAIARACQQAAIHGTQFRLAVTDPVIRWVLGIEGLDRLVAIYPSPEAATAAGTPETGTSTWPPVLPPRHNGASAGSSADVSPAAGITPAVLWQLLDSLGDGLALTSQDGKIALVNRRCAEMFGYKREELVGLPVDALVPPDVRNAHQGYRAGYIRVPRSRPMGDRARLAGLRRDGGTFPVEISLSPVPTATEHFVLAVIRDAGEVRRHHDLADLARAAAVGQWRMTKDLLDRVVHRLSQVGLTLQGAAELQAQAARERLGEALDELDDTIREIRDYAFSSGDDEPPWNAT
jgi:PAS domain S-box-containing protein